MSKVKADRQTERQTNKQIDFNRKAHLRNKVERLFRDGMLTQ